MSKLAIADDSQAHGTNRTYAERAAKGQPNVTFSLTNPTDLKIDQLSHEWGVSRSQVIDILVAHASGASSGIGRTSAWRAVKRGKAP